MIFIDSFAWLLWAILILLLPVKWLLCAGLAALVHELFHFCAVILLGGRVLRIRLFPAGAVMETDGVSGFREGLCALAGPVGSFLLVLFIRRFPVLGLFALVQGCFNLLPIDPMDGSRVLRSILDAIFPERAARYAHALEVLILCAIFLLVSTVSVRYRFGLLPLVYCVLAFANVLLRKRP